MELKLPVLQIVGFQNSGKTTLLARIVKELSEDGVKIGTLKHHGHGGFPDLSDEGKDTSKHRQAGAKVIGVEGAGMLQLQAFNEDGWTLQDMLLFYNKLPIDLILLEGFKRECFPKIVLLRSKEDEKLLEQLVNIQAVISWYKPVKVTEQIPTFHIDDVTGYLKWTRSYFERKDWIE